MILTTDNQRTAVQDQPFSRVVFCSNHLTGVLHFFEVAGVFPLEILRQADGTPVLTLLAPVAPTTWRPIVEANISVTPEANMGAILR